MLQRIRFLREPVLTLTPLIAPAAGLVLLFIADLPAETQAAWNGAATAAAGLITAALVARDRLAPAIMGFVQTVLQLLAVFGFGLSAEQTTGLMGFVALVVGMWLRTQVFAKVDANGAPREPAQLRAA